MSMSVSKKSEEPTAMVLAMVAALNKKSADTISVQKSPVAKKVGAFKTSIRKRAPTTGTGTAEKLEEISALVERGHAADEFFSQLPMLVVGICEKQMPVRNDIRSGLVKAHGMAKTNLYDARAELDEELARYINADPTLFDGGGDLTGPEREVARQVSRVAYIAWAIQNCPPRFGAINWLVNDERNVFNAVALGVLVNAGENDKKPFVWVGKKPNAIRLVLNPDCVFAEEIVRKNWEAATGKLYTGIVGALVFLSTKAKNESERFVTDLKKKFYSDVTKGATVKDLIAENGNEVIIILTDPGEEKYPGGQVRVFRSIDGFVSLLEAMGGNHRQIAKLKEDGVAIPVEALRADNWKGDADEWLLWKILRRAIKSELAKLGSSEKKLANDTAPAVIAVEPKPAKKNKGKKAAAAAQA